MSSIWQQVVQACTGSGGDGPAKGKGCSRVVIVGSSGAGKRSLSQRLMDPQWRNRQHQESFGSGITQVNLDTKTQVYELVSCDFSNALPVAIPDEETARRSFVIFALDGGECSTLLSSLLTWRDAVSKHVSSILGDQRDSVLAHRQAEWTRQKQEYSVSRQDYFEAGGMEYTDGNAPENFGMSSGSICPLPGLVIVNKFDLVERQCKSSAPKVGELSVALFLQQTLRKAALEMRCGFAMNSAKSTNAAMVALYQGLWADVTQSLTANNTAAAAPSKSEGDGQAPKSESNDIENSIHVQPDGHCFFPPGLDVLDALSPIVVAGMHSFNETFRRPERPQPTIVRHEEVIKELKFTAGADSQAMVWDE